MSEQFYATKDQLIDIMKSQAVPVLGAGGGFAPIGTEAYFDGTTAPQGWLICDGSTKNINDYPELAAYIASQHGSSNYYGGNGTTTFGLPKRLGMPYNADALYDTSERVVGIYTDGKPLYKKVINFGALPNAKSKEVAHGITNINASSFKLVQAFANRPNDTITIPFLNLTSLSGAINLLVTTTNVKITTGEDRSNSTAFVYLYYTKTTDSTRTLPSAGHSADGNGVFCIRAGVSGDANTHVYSTTEQIVGEWIDGKTIYEKTIVDTLPVTETNGVRASKQIPTGTNISKITAVSAFCYSSTGVICPLYGSVVSSRENDVGYQVRSNTASTNNNSITVYNANNIWNGIEVIFTIQYTKTT